MLLGLPTSTTSPVSNDTAASAAASSTQRQRHNILRNWLLSTLPSDSASPDTRGMTRSPHNDHSSPGQIASPEAVVLSGVEARQRAERRAPRARMLPIVNSGVFPEARHPGAPDAAAPGDPLSAASSPVLQRSESAQQALSAHLPSIQFIPAADAGRGRPSLDFRRVTRILPHTDAIIKVGRYSERDSTSDPNGSTPSDAPIGFKSKVVSRRHCEFSYSNNQWFVKDVKSSSGTFLNHIRLSQPGMESRLYPVNDGDTVQLGIDFKGGEEMIFRCVKIRVETNRGWQRGLNKFNRSTHKRLQALARGRGERGKTEASKQSTDCTICLNSIQPCQALFVAPCSHAWHYKCIRQILDEAVSSQFLCPNCRALADLDAEIEDTDLADFEDDFEDDLDQFDEAAEALDPDAADEEPSGSADALRDSNGVDDAFTRPVERPTASLNGRLEALDGTTRGVETAQGVSGSRRQSLLREQSGNTTGSSTPGLTFSEAISIQSLGLAPGFALPARARTNTNLTMASELSDGPSETGSLGASPGLGVNSLEGFVRDGPMTPRNNAGPFVFDGAAEPSGRSRGRLSGVDEEQARPGRS